MSDPKKLSPEELNKLVAQFNSLESYEEKCRFFHDPANAPLQAVVNGIHFPKPTDKPAQT